MRRIKFLWNSENIMCRNLYCRQHIESINISFKQYFGPLQNERFLNRWDVGRAYKLGRILDYEISSDRFGF